MRQEIENNLMQAIADMKTACDNIMSQNYYASAFFAEQAAEKSLKALYIHQKSTFPEKTHNLVKLSRELSAPVAVIKSAESLTPAAVLTRYSDILGMPPAKYYTLEIAQRSVREAEVILKWVKEQLK